MHTLLDKDLCAVFTLSLKKNLLPEGHNETNYTKTTKFVFDINFYHNNPTIKTAGIPFEQRTKKRDDYRNTKATKKQLDFYGKTFKD